MDANIDATMTPAEPHLHKFLFSSSGRPGAKEWMISMATKIRALGGVVSDSCIETGVEASDVDITTTHLITRSPLQRTAKVIKACVMGMHILDDSFVDASTAAATFVAEQPYRAHSAQLREGAAAQWRLMWNNEKQRALTHQQIFILSKEGDSRTEHFKDILEIAGAAVQVSPDMSSCRNVYSAEMGSCRHADYACVMQKDLPKVKQESFTAICKSAPTIQLVDQTHLIDLICLRAEPPDVVQTQLSMLF